MDYLPLHFDLRDQIVLLVGGGAVAARKAALLLSAGAKLRLVAPEVDETLAEKLAEHEVLRTRYSVEHLEGVCLVVAATSDPEVNVAVSGHARDRNIPVNVVDNPSLCTVVFPAIIDRSPVILSVGTGGASPVLARNIRGLIEAMLPEGISRIAEFLRSRRKELKTRLPDVGVRRQVTEAFLESPGSELAARGRDAEAEAYLNEVSASGTGEVFLIGAGPGDPDLLTLKALQLLQKADVVLYDSLVSPGVLDRCRRDASREFVGKRSGYRSTSQETINELLVRLAKEGNRVARLKGGDPFIFGRGGEEIETLIEEGIPFQVIPGITAASGCAAYAGIPLTHRDHAQSVRFVTGHPRNGAVDLNWEEFVSPGQTLVFYMGLGGLQDICTRLIQHGKKPETPVAVISKGTTPEQAILCATLETISGLVARTQIQTPTLIIVGEVVSLYPGVVREP